MLFRKDAPGENLVIRGARVLDPVRELDATLDVRIDDGVIAALGTELEPNAHKVIDAQGLVLAPAFVDPHVHLRTPGREDEETIASATAAGAAGGFCAILAMPNTDPVVDSAATLGSLADAARGEADIRVGFLAAITKAQAGTELTEMGALADAGAVGFTDDGVPVTSPGLMRRALQYGHRIAVHCEEPTLSRNGQMHEGAVSAELGFAAIRLSRKASWSSAISRSRRTSSGRSTCCISRRGSQCRRSGARSTRASPRPARSLHITSVSPTRRCGHSIRT